MLTKDQLRKLADYLSEHVHEAHRGVIEVGGAVLAFGNDGYERSEQTRNYVQAFAVHLYTSHGWRTGNVVTDSQDGYTWVSEIFPTDGTEPRAAQEDAEAAIWCMCAVGLAGEDAGPEVIQDKFDGLGYQRAEAASVIPLHRRRIAEMLGLPVPKRDADVPPPLPPIAMILAAKGTEPVRIVIDGVPYRAKAVEVISHGMDTPGEAVVLLENVGQHSTCRVTSDDGLRSYRAGTILFGKDAGETNDSGERLLAKVDL